jgi:hypothetical protein
VSGRSQANVGFSTRREGETRAAPPGIKVTALVVLTMIRLLAYALSMIFYQRQVFTHARGRCDIFHGFAKRLAYAFAAASPDSS